LSVGFVAYFGSLNAAAAWLNGKSFSIEPRTVSLENREPGVEEIVTFHLRNLSSNEISVVGEKSSCSCVFSENIPIVAQPKETVELKVRAQLPKYKSDYDQTILLMVATPKKLEISPVRIIASIPNPLPPPDADTEPKASTENQPKAETKANAEIAIPVQEGLESSQERTDQNENLQ